jgi:hypothetical protein
MWRLNRLDLTEAEFLKQVSCKLKNGMRLSDSLKESVDSNDPGPTLLAAFVPSGTVLPMEQISRQRGLVTRDLFRNIEALWAMQARRKAIEGEK